MPRVEVHSFPFPRGSKSCPGAISERRPFPTVMLLTGQSHHGAGRPPGGALSEVKCNHPGVQRRALVLLPTPTNKRREGRSWAQRGPETGMASRPRGQALGQRWAQCPDWGWMPSVGGLPCTEQQRSSTHGCQEHPSCDNHKAPGIVNVLCERNCPQRAG